MPRAPAPSPAADLRHAQLFLDDAWIDDAFRVSRVWHQPRKYPEPVIRADRPWERNAICAYGTVLHWQGRFHAWYVSWTRNPGPRACYAVSDDGVHWDKPALRLHEVAGTRDNNVVLVAQHPEGIIDDLTVIDDPDDARWPLKMLYWDSGTRAGGRQRDDGIGAARSADGIHWEKIGLVLPDWIDRFNAVSTRIDGKYVIFGRKPWTMHTAEQRGRRVWRIESRDLRRWSEARLVLEPDIEDPPRMQYYSLSAFPYEGLLLGAIERMYMAPDKLDAELVWSRDGGQSWQRSRTRPRFIEWGLRDTWDSAWANLSTAAPIRRGNRLWFYYSGRSGAHGVPYPHNHGAIGLATLRLDGFCSLQAVEEEGFVVTPPLTWPGGELLVNYDARRDLTSHPGYAAAYSGAVGLRVEVRNADHRPLKGCAAADCAALAGNSELSEGGYHAVRWSGERSMDRHRGKRVRLCFRLRDAHLYAFRAAPAG